MIWILLLGAVFGLGGMMEEEARIGLPACPSIDVQMALQSAYPGAQIEIVKQEYITCNNMEAKVEVEAYINGKKMKLMLSQKGSQGPVSVRVMEREYEEYKLNETLVKPNIAATYIIVKDGKAEFWFLNNSKIVKTTRGTVAKCSGKANEVWVAKEGYAVKQINITKKGCYYVDFEKDTITYEASCKIPPKEPIKVEERYENEYSMKRESNSSVKGAVFEIIERKVKSEYGDDIKIVDVKIVSKNKAKVVYKSKIKIPFLGITLPIEAEHTAEIELDKS